MLVVWNQAPLLIVRKRMKAGTTIFLVVMLTALVLSASAQNNRKATLRGVVIDDSTRAPICGANVFLANSTIGASTDSGGMYLMNNVPPGIYDIVGSCIGYKPRTSRIDVHPSTSTTFDIQLRPADLSMGVVEVTAQRSEEWQDNLKVFTAHFLGTTPSASRCRIINPEVIHFSTGMFGQLQASANQEIVLDNPALGFLLHVILETFSTDGRSVTVEYKTRFEDRSAAHPEGEAEWMENRDDAYFGSVRHFLKSLINDELSSEGYTMFALETLSDLSKTSPRIEQKRGDVVRAASANNWSVGFPRYLVVTYDRKQVDVEPGQFYGSLDSFKDRSMEQRKSRPQMGILVLTKGSLVVDTQGRVLDRLGYRVLGDWDADGLANELPLDFQPKTRR